MNYGDKERDDVKQVLNIDEYSEIGNSIFTE